MKPKKVYMRLRNKYLLLGIDFVLDLWYNYIYAINL